MASSMGVAFIRVCFLLIPRFIYFTTQIVLFINSFSFSFFLSVYLRLPAPLFFSHNLVRMFSGESTDATLYSNLSNVLSKNHYG